LFYLLLIIFKILMMIITKNLDIINRGIGQYQYSQSEYDPYGNKILTENQKKA